MQRRILSNPWIAAAGLAFALGPLSAAPAGAASEHSVLTVAHTAELTLAGNNLASAKLGTSAALSGDGKGRPWSAGADRVPAPVR